MQIILDSSLIILSKKQELPSNLNTCTKSYISQKYNQVKELLINVANVLPTKNHDNSVNDCVRQVNVHHVLEKLSDIDYVPSDICINWRNEEPPEESKVSQAPTHFGNDYFRQ